MSEHYRELDWPARRSAGESASFIAHRAGGTTLGAIADAAGVMVSMVRRKTAPLGPLGPPGPRLPVGVEGAESIARRVGVSPVTVGRWRDAGRLPEPDSTTARGRALWLPATVDRWLSGAALGTCPDCGARCFSVGRHQSQAHRSKKV